MSIQRFACVVAGSMALGCFEPSDDGGDEIAATDTTGDTTATDDATTTATDDATTTDDDTTGTDDATTDPTEGNTYEFAENPPEDYTRVDRMGMPAIATAVITSKDDYNAANPTDDVSSDFVPEIVANVMGLHAALDDDIMSVGLIPCAVADCVQQAGPLVIPDTLKIDLSSPAGFPNGRTLTDPVIDITFAVVLLDLTAMGQSPFVLADIPLNPSSNDVAFLADFPHLADPH